MRIAYKKGFKYQLIEDYSADIPIFPASIAENDYVVLGLGHIFIRAGYAWDGPSGPTFDTKTFMRGSLVHDALYQLMREGLLSLDRVWSDRLLRQMCREDGMCRLRAWWVFKGVRWGGRGSASPRGLRAVLRAP